MRNKEDLITIFLIILFYLFLILGVSFNISLLFVAIVLGVISALNISKRGPEEIDNFLIIYMYLIFFLPIAFAITDSLSWV